MAIHKVILGEMENGFSTMYFSTKYAKLTDIGGVVSYIYGGDVQLRQMDAEERVEEECTEYNSIFNIANSPFNIDEIILN